MGLLKVLYGLNGREQPKMAASTLHHIETSVYVKYTLGIRDAYNAYESAPVNAIHARWLAKSTRILESMAGK